MLHILIYQKSGVWAGRFLALKNYCLALFSLGVTPSNLKAVLFTNDLLIFLKNGTILRNPDFVTTTIFPYSFS